MTSDSSITGHDFFMQRCLQLAALGAGYVAPNPMVGAVLVHNQRIIGEGYHQKYGEAHAEVNCIASVTEQDRNLISQSTLYVSLEPCAHHGKTPPCADLIIKNKIGKVVIGCRDPFKEVDGKGIEKLKSAGVEIVLGVLEVECKEMNKRFLTFHTKHRPYIILKWAETGDEFIATSPHPDSYRDPLQRRGAFEDSVVPRLLISNEYSNRLVHKWRSEESAILVGTNTALADNPELTTRLWDGPSPIRLIVDMDLRLPLFLKIFDKKVRTIIFNRVKHEEDENVLYYQVTEEVSIVHQVIHALYQLKIQSVIVEGGAKLLQSFIDEQSWDEARIIRNTKLTIDRGLPAPQLNNAHESESYLLENDLVTIFKPAHL
ncbi:MAG: bifunctional diaminohydroxyphosphoribosylaminopyrimidine deaminase/5-amino-6-(5-phosphoribosylamino)uracil reductase RibD [Bacteroidota bacterium]